MRRSTAVAMCALALLLTLACKKKTWYQGASPNEAIASFEKAFNQGNIPDDLGALVSSDLEKRKWKLRCRSAGCTKASMKVVGKPELGEYRAVLLVDFWIENKMGLRFFKGTRARVSLVREGGRWFVEAFDESVPEKKPPPAAPVAPPSATDAGFKSP